MTEEKREPESSRFLQLESLEPPLYPTNCITTDKSSNTM